MQLDTTFLDFGSPSSWDFGDDKPPLLVSTGQYRRLPCNRTTCYCLINRYQNKMVLEIEMPKNLLFLHEKWPITFMILVSTLLRASRLSSVQNSLPFHYHGYSEGISMMTYDNGISASILVLNHQPEWVSSISRSYNQHPRPWPCFLLWTQTWRRAPELRISRNNLQIEY